MGIRASVANIARVEKVVTVLMHHGLEVPIARARLTHCATWRCRMHCTMQRWKGRWSSQKPWPRAVRDAMVELGPAFVKLGQILSVRSDLIPAELVEELRTLQSTVPAFPYEQVRERIEEETGEPLEKLFKRFTEEPLAAASMAQVHEAELHDGTRVAVKVKRPGIDAVVRRDMDVLVWLAEHAERHWTQARRFRPKASAQELRKYTLRELDFRHEARIAARLSKHYEGRPGVRVPKVYKSTQGLLVMEFIDGVPFDDLEALDEAGVDREALVKLALDAVLAQIFEFGLFHGDPHPGNLHVTSSGELVFLDFGIFGEFDERMRRLTALLMHCLVRGDIDLGISYLLRMATLGPDADPETFRREIAARYRDWRGSSVSEYGFAELLYEELSLGAQNDIIFPNDMVLFGKAMLTIEGVVLAVDPDIDLSKAAAPYMEKVRAQLFGRERLMEAVERSMPLWWELAERLPVTLPQALDRLLAPPSTPAPARSTPAPSLPWPELATIGAGVALLVADVGPLWREMSVLGLTVLAIGIVVGVAGRVGQE
ncbi:MAG: AarF/ABC1/UbiB kinase family protein [Deltaproteobacteria bacterium]|nr:AarF/ABC1/UbiB kinase family protein [Deltaproteobacteria bacterium]